MYFKEREGREKIAEAKILPARTRKWTLTPHPALSPLRGEGIQPAACKNEREGGSVDAEESALTPEEVSNAECGMSNRTRKWTLTPHPALSPLRGEGIQPAAPTFRCSLMPSAYETKTAFALVAANSGLIEVRHLRSIGHSRRKQGEQGASDLRMMFRLSPGKPGAVSSGE